MGYAITLLISAAFLTLGVLFYVGQIGKPRKPIRPSDAIAVIVIDSAIIVSMTIGAMHLL
jgi:hypothetical protein